jgi:3-oxoacyl-[acyl-carrier protein] reductase
MAHRLDGRTILITGAASGIGAATASKLAGESAAVVAFDLSRSVEEVVRNIVAEGGRAIACVGDVSMEVDCEAAVTMAVDTWGQIDAVVNCAGVFPRAPVTEMSVETWDNVMAVNLRGAFLLSKHAASAMQASGNGGSIVHIASVGGVVGIPNLCGYAASKGGVIALVRQLAVELASWGIRVNGICPGATDTPAFYARPDLVTDPSLLERVRDSYPLLRYHSRLIQPEEIADGAVFLCSDESRMVTGVLLPIDGGYLAQ